MKNERNPIPIDSKKTKKTTTKAAAKHTATRREKMPEKAKKAGPSKNSAKHRATDRTKAAEQNKATHRTRRSAKSRKAEPEAHSDSTPVRLPENKHPDLHQRSYAAHLDGGPQVPHTKPAGLLRYGAFPMARKQP
jgi:hypothetical protein